VLGRRPLRPVRAPGAPPRVCRCITDAPKLTGSMPSFLTYSRNTSHAKGEDACIWALGSSQVGKTESSTRSLQKAHDGHIKRLRAASVGSSPPLPPRVHQRRGSRPSGKSKTLFARVKVRCLCSRLACYCYTYCPCRDARRTGRVARRVAGSVKGSYCVQGIHTSSKYPAVPTSAV